MTRRPLAMVRLHLRVWLATLDLPVLVVSAAVVGCIAGAAVVLDGPPAVALLPLWCYGRWVVSYLWPRPARLGAGS